MDNDLRKNPRFISTDGVPARVFLEDQVLEGNICNFSSTGFALIVTEELGELSPAPLEIVFTAAPKNTELKIAAVVTNRSPRENGETRLGCQITDLRTHANDYFFFLTQIMSRQGFLKSMATKPLKCRTT